MSAQTLVALPFANRTTGKTGQANMDWIGESIAETVRDVAGEKGILTFEHEEVDQASQRLGLRSRTLLTNASALKIGDALDAEHVLYGTFQFVPDVDTSAPAATSQAAAGLTSAVPTTPMRGTLRITGRVIDRRHLHLSSEFTETGSLDDLLTLEAHVAWRVLTLVVPKLAPQESSFQSLRATVRLDAEESYIRGLLATTAMDKERFLLQATRIDAKFSHANLALGKIHFARKEYRQAADWLQKLPPDDPHFREATFLLGLAQFQSSDYAGAQKAFQIVADAVPLGEVLNNLGAAQSRRGVPGAAESFRAALSGDPSDPVYHFNLGYALWRSGDFSNAADRFRAVLDRQPDDQSATLLLGMCLRKQGPRPGDARLEALERVKTNYEERAYLQLKSLVAPPVANGPSK
ncbi:MAG: tetratricopeptide repeat protein [Bryobacteraceae bacterium]